MAKADHERQRLFPQHFWANENRVQKERYRQVLCANSFTSLAELSLHRAGKTHLKKYKAYCACERDLEMLNDEEPELNFNQRKRLEEVRKNKCMIENWLSILSDEERCIIQLHLIDGKSWKRIEAE